VVVQLHRSLRRESAPLSAALLAAREAPPTIRWACPPAPAIHAAHGPAVPNARAGPTFPQVASP